MAKKQPSLKELIGEEPKKTKRGRPSKKKAARREKKPTGFAEPVVPKQVLNDSSPIEEKTWAHDGIQRNTL